MPPAAATAIELFDAAVAGADPAARVAAAVAKLPLAQKNRVWLFSIGKAAHSMAAGAVEGLRSSMVGIAGGLIIAPERAASPHAAIEAVTGDHPVPGRASFAAAQRLADLARGMRSTDAVIVLVSGGATSLMAAPMRGIAESDLADLFALLLARGLPIGEMNAIRKRFTRWGGGRLAVAVAPASTWCFAISDVVGDDIAGIGSGPCSPDAATATEVKAILERAGIYGRVPAPMRSVLEQTHKGLHAETPKPRHPAFAHVSCAILLRNADALAAAEARARGMGLDVEVVRQPLEGEAVEQGERIAQALIERRGRMSSGQRLCVLWGGEPTVTLAAPVAATAPAPRTTASLPAPVPPGGRCQELALAAARALGHAGAGAAGIGVLAAGTDGRDGNTDAAGAFVDASTWQAIHDAGHDPARRLAAHDSHSALAAAGALFRPGATGTNVMDVVIGLIET